MGSLGTFGSFTQARLGIYAAQQGLNVTGNNIANINTHGYTRQRLEQSSMYAGTTDRYFSSDMNVGFGVRCTGVSQLRDPYLDIRYRSKIADMGSMNAKLGALQNVQAILDEVGKGEDGFGIIEDQLNDLFNTLEQLSEKTGQNDYEVQVRSSAEALVKKFNAYAAQLEEVGRNAQADLEQNIESVNKILVRIRDLNSDIRKSEIHGDKALELRDERNLLIDELSEYMRIDVTYEEEDIGAGQTVEKLVIRLGGMNPDSDITTDSSVLVDGIYATELAYRQVPILNPNYDANDSTAPGKGKYMTPTGGTTDNIDDAKVGKSSHYDLDLEPLRDVNGQLIKGSDGKKIPLDDNDLYGVIQSQREFLTESGEFASADELARVDEGAKSKRGLPYYRHVLDLLANQIATQFNKANSGLMKNEKGEYIDANGDPVNLTGKTEVEDLIKRGGPYNQEETDKLKDANLVLKQGVLFSNHGAGNSTDKITASNISISKQWSEGHTIVNSFVIPTGFDAPASTDSSNIQHMITLFNKKMDYTPNTVVGDADSAVMFHGSFQEMWTNIGTVLGNDMMVTETMLDTYEASAVNLDMQRDGVSSVDLNDEAMNLMQYSKSYNAACRLMTTLDSVLDKLINGTAL